MVNNEFRNSTLNFNDNPLDINHSKSNKRKFLLR